jgi:hypothetical protein
MDCTIVRMSPDQADRMSRNIRSAWSGDMRIKMLLLIVKWARSYWSTTADNGNYKHNDIDEDVNI